MKIAVIIIPTTERGYNFCFCCRYDIALEALDEISKLDETNPAARKRKVAIFKAMGNTTDAIKELVQHLQA